MDGVADGKFNAHLKRVRRHSDLRLFLKQISSLEAWTKAPFAFEVTGHTRAELPAGTGAQGLGAGQQLP